MLINILETYTKIEIKTKHDNLINLNNKTHQNISISTLTSALWTKYYL